MAICERSAEKWHKIEYYAAFRRPVYVFLCIFIQFYAFFKPQNIAKYHEKFAKIIAKYI